MGPCGLGMEAMSATLTGRPAEVMPGWPNRIVVKAIEDRGRVRPNGFGAVAGLMDKGETNFVPRGIGAAGKPWAILIQAYDEPQTTRRRRYPHNEMLGFT